MKCFPNFYRNATSLFLVLVFVLSLLGGCARNTEDDITGPLIWRVTASDAQTMYLFGSIHAADEELYPLPDAIMNAFDDCDYLAVEADIIAFEQDMEALMSVAYALMYPEGSTIADEIGEELHERAKAVMAELESELAELGIPLEMLDRFRPYFWIQILTGIAIERVGLSLELGLDKYFLEKAKDRDMEILEVESIEEQLQLLIGFSQPLQAALLESYLDLDKTVSELKELYELWKQGDRRALEALFDSDTDDLPQELAAEYIDGLLTQRDLGMVEVAERYMTEGKTVFYIVGLAHMVGENGIVAQLIEKGYTVERLPV